MSQKPPLNPREYRKLLEDAGEFKEYIEKFMTKYTKDYDEFMKNVNKGLYVQEEL